MDRFDIFHRSGSLLNMRSQVSLNVAAASASEQKRASAH